MRVLVVDDSAVAREAVRELLGDQGHAVAAAGDGTTAVALVASVDPDLVLVDATLSGESGLAVARMLADARPDVPVVLMSVDPVSEGDVSAAGARGFVAKERLATVDLAALVG